MAKRSQGLSQQIAADAVGMSVRSAQRIDRGDHQPQNQPQCGRSWRTRADSLAEVWDSVLVPMLEKAPQHEPQTLLLHLEQIRPGEEWFRRKRTLQRRAAAHASNSLAQPSLERGLVVVLVAAPGVKL
jgi:hypothetical protein